MRCKRLGTCEDRLHRKTWLMAKVPVQGGFELFDPLRAAPFGWLVGYRFKSGSGTDRSGTCGKKEAKRVRLSLERASAAVLRSPGT